MVDVNLLIPGKIFHYKMYVEIKLEHSERDLKH